MGQVLTIENLSKEITNKNVKNSILNNINLTVKEKEYVAIMGASGSGKTTLLGIISGIDSLTSGKVFIDKTDISKLNDNKLTEFRNENIGIVFQSFNLIPVLSAKENIEVPLYFSDKGIDVEAKVNELLELVGLKDKANFMPEQLSGGEQQRIAIARALATEPRILFADEPTGALDSKNGQNIMDIFEQFRQKYGMTIVMVTHDKVVAERADRILYMQDGSFVEGVKYSC
jgi:putative ABC transport system ATP-binding protein